MLYFKGIRKITGIFILLLAFTASCVPLEKLTYFNDINELEEPDINPMLDKVIMPFDRLYIKVFSIDEKTNLLFNSGENMASGSTPGIIGDLVDAAGNINYPFVGEIAVGGLTLTSAGKKIEAALKQYVPNAAVSVKLIDNNVTILGEVQNQGMFPFSKEKLNIYEALALGGGLTQYGDHNNIILIRQENGKVMHHKLNLSDSKISGKDYYYILSSDVIVVEPIKNKSHSYGNNTISIFLNSLTAVIAVFIFLGVKF